MNYKLDSGQLAPGKPGAPVRQPVTLRSGYQRLKPLMAGESRAVTISGIAILVSSLASLAAPVLIAQAVDTYVRHGDASGLTRSALMLLGVYLCGVLASYIQVRTMGAAGRRLLFRLRNALFTKLQELPVAFFNQNKAGDLISRLNNDTDKINQFVAQALMQFIGSAFMIVGAGIFLLSLSFLLGAAALLPALAVLLITKSTSGWVKGRNVKSLQGLGAMSGEIQESLNNFKVIVAFNRVDYFRRKFSAANETNYAAATAAGYANNIFMPLYGLSAGIAQLIVITYGIWLIGTGHITLGLLMGFLMYVNSFYMPLRQIASVWASFQMGLAAFERISEVLKLESNMTESVAGSIEPGSVLAFRNVHFAYPDGKEILHNISFNLEPGKAYALVGPTGGGKPPPLL